MVYVIVQPLYTNHVFADLVMMVSEEGLYDSRTTLELFPVIGSKMLEETFTVFVIKVPLANHVRTVAVKVIAPVVHDTKFTPVM
jgi:hypothetical protein